MSGTDYTRRDSNAAERRRDTADREVPPGWKRCSNPSCRRMKPLEAFWRNKRNADGRGSWCRTCMGASASAFHQTEEYRLWCREYERLPKSRDARRAYQTSEAGRAVAAAYRASPRGRLAMARKRTLFDLARAATPKERARLRARAKLYDGCLAALDPSDGVPVPAGARRCTECGTPKPLVRGQFYADRGAPGGFSLICRVCRPATRAERKAVTDRAWAASARGRVSACLREARKRLAGAKTEKSRRTTAARIGTYEAELDRMARAANGRGHKTKRKT